jgi:predicted deacylase
MDEGSTIPVTIVHGASDGPVLALIAGIHGYPITALQAVRTQVDPAALNRAMRMVVV